jgi:hypothetical protein
MMQHILEALQVFIQRIQPFFSGGVFPKLDAIFFSFLDAPGLLQLCARFSLALFDCLFCLHKLWE